MIPYVELHCHSNYSFQEGASSLEELLIRADELGYPALALTDHDNLGGAMEFSRLANSIHIQPITGAEVTLSNGSHLTLLAETRQGYSNLCNLMTASRMGLDGERMDPKLNPVLLKEYSEGLILLTGCAKGSVPRLVSEERTKDAEAELRSYIDWFGTASVFVELQQNLIYGDTLRNKRLIQLACTLGIAVVATNNVHYHLPERHRLQDVLVAIKHNKTLEETHRERRANSNFYLRSREEMDVLFQAIPEAVNNTFLIANRCTFNLETKLGYSFPEYSDLPPEHTAQSYLEQVCEDAAIRKYGLIRPDVRERLDEEFRLIKMHGLSGFFLIYYEVIKIAREVMIDLGHSDPEIPLEERPPGRGRGSSVSMLVGYLIGLSHIDPLKYGLAIDRFLNEGIGNIPDIDIDFPRDIREETIKRIHDKYGWERSVLTGAIATYKMRGCIRDLGKALGIPLEDVDKLAKKVDSSHGNSLKSEMETLPDFRHKIGVPVWDTLIGMASELQGFPKYLMQHSSGMIISDKPIMDMVPIQPGGLDNRYICQWDKDSIADAGFVKIDFLGLGALSQMHETLELVEERTGKFVDLSMISDDQNVYDSIHKADTVGIFQIESPAQMQTVVRLKPNSFKEMAYEVAAVRPGVGINHGVSQFIERYRKKVEWDYDHPRERKALERTLGIILYQDQVNELAVEVAGLTYKDGDNLRRAFGRKNSRGILKKYWEKFRDGASVNGVAEDVARKVFGKFSGQYMFPESHAYAFGITAYQMSWLKYHYPLEFYVAIFNQQPMGFYNLETLKEDANRHGIQVLNPDINHSIAKCTIVDDETFRLGFMEVDGLGESKIDAIIQERDRGGNFNSLSDAMNRSGLQRDDVENLVTAGAFDSMVSDRRTALWKVGLLYQPVGAQKTLEFPVEQDMGQLPLITDWEIMLSEYRTMSIHPTNHFMAYLREDLPDVASSQEILGLENGAEVTVAGLVIRRQHPGSKAVFITLEDEFGHISLVVWPKIFELFQTVIKNPVLKIRGFVSRKEGTFNVVAQYIESIPITHPLPTARDWR